MQEEMPSYMLQEIDPRLVASSLQKFGGICLRNAIAPEIVCPAYAGQKKLMDDMRLLESLPYDRRTRLGYTPPNVEGLQHKLGSANPNRRCFDYNPSLMKDKTQEMLFDAVILLCRVILKMVDETQKIGFANLPEGSHILRIAQYLNKEEDPDTVLFPLHSDFGLLTAFIGTEATGLQVADKKGIMHEASLGFGDVLIGVGTPFTQYIPYFRTLRHQVVGTTKERLSSFLFYELDDEVVLPSGERYGDFTNRILNDIRVPA